MARRKDDMQPTILVIEDDPIAANLIKLILGRNGCRTLIAFDGLEGLKTARSEPVDLILLDLMLPGIDGFEVLSRLRADPRTASLPVAIVSVKAQTTDKRAAAKVGADAYLTKPYDTAELTALVDSLLQGEADEPALCALSGLVMGSHRKDAARMALHLGQTLIQDAETTTTIVDLHPLSTEHSLLLGLPAPENPISLADPETMAHLADLAVHHSSGLRVLNHLQGRGQAGQLASKDIDAVTEALSAENGYILADLPPDYPTEVLCHMANHCAQVLLVTRDDPDSVRSTQAALTVMERGGVDGNKIALVVVGSAAGEALFDREILCVIRTEITGDLPVFGELAGRLRETR